MRHREQGATMIEFALIAGVFFMVLFGVIEFGRALFAWNTLTEATRRGARLAAVCPVDHPSVANVTVFNDPDASGASAVLSGLDTGMVTVEYPNDGGIQYVRVRIDNYQHQLLIPFFSMTLTGPPFETTLPAESLGAVPNPVTGTGTTMCP